MADTGIEIEGSPADRRRERVRSLILQAAEQVFREEGEDGLSIRRLADEVDYSPAAIYKYFGSKSELVEELKNAFFGKLLDAMDQHDRSGDFINFFIEGLMLYVSTAMSSPHHYSAAFTLLDDRDEAEAVPSDMPCSKKDIAFQRLLAMVEEGIELGALRSDIAPDMIAKSLWASAHGLVMIATHFPGFPQNLPVPSDTTLDAFIRFHCEQAVAGFKS